MALPAGDRHSRSPTPSSIAAYDRGLEVEVVTDFDQSNSTKASLDVARRRRADHALADDGIGYFEFNTNDDVEPGPAIRRS